MCIRDRLWSEPLVIATSNPSSPPSVVEGLFETEIAMLSSFSMVAIATGAMIQPPVSYTHLRAHETVLDLVCRLLLEKKKKEKKKNIYNVDMRTNLEQYR